MTDRHHRGRLAAGRTLAWALLVAGWLALGSLGRQHLPLQAGGLLPLALWLAALAAALAVAALRHWSAGGVRALLVAGMALGAGGAATLATRPAAGLTALALGWALGLVGASLAVRRLRQPLRGAPPPVGAAVLGAGLAWAAWAGPALVAPGWALQPAVGALLLAALAAAWLAGALAVAGPPVRACRSGLFDCALALGRAADWRTPARWPAAVAALAMLPMMASLSALDEACSAWGLAAGAAAAGHLAAMLLPAWWAGRSGWRPAQDPRLLAGLLALGGAALLAWPGQAGAMAAAGLHGLAWSLAWAARWAAPCTPGAPAAMAGAPGAVAAGPGVAARAPVAVGAAASSALGPAAGAAAQAAVGAGAAGTAARAAAPACAAALGVLLLGQAWARHGPLALQAVHGLLAMAGLVALVAQAGPGPLTSWRRGPA